MAENNTEQFITKKYGKTITGDLIVLGNASIENFYVTNQTISNISYSDTFSSSNLLAVNITSTNLKLTNLSGSGCVFSNIVTSNLTATNILTTNITAAAGRFNNVDATNGIIRNIIATNLTSDNGVITNLTSTNLNAANSTFINIVATNITSTNNIITTTTNITTTNLTATNIVSTNNTQNTIYAKKINVPWYSSNTHIFSSQLTNITSATGVTITAAQLLTMSIIRSGQTNTITDQLPTAAQIINEINVITNSQASAGMNFTTIFYNGGSHRENLNFNGVTSQVDAGTVQTVRFLITNTTTPAYVFHFH